MKVKTEIIDQEKKLSEENTKEIENFSQLVSESVNRGDYVFEGIDNLFLFY